MPSSSRSRTRRTRDDRDSDEDAVVDYKTASRSVWNCVPGSIANLEHKIVALPQIGDGDVLVQVRAIGLNFADVFECQNLYQAVKEMDQETKNKFIPGLEFSGTILAVGDNVKPKNKYKVGSRVFGVTKFGAFSTVVAIDHRYVRAVPANWSFNQAASFLCQALTAWYGLYTLGKIKRGKTVLIHSAAGGTGLFCVKICQKLGALPIATVGSSRKIAALTSRRDIPAAAATVVVAKTSATSAASTSEAEGGGLLVNPLPAEVVIDRSSVSDKAAAVKSALSYYNRTGVDLVFDSLLGDWFSPVFENLLNPQGHHVVLGAGSMTSHSDSPNWFQLIWRYLKRPLVDPLACISTNKNLNCFNLIFLFEQYDEMLPIMNEMFECLGYEEGEEDSEPEPPFVGHVYDFLDIPAAIRKFQSGETTGKVVIEVDDCLSYPLK